MSTPYTTPPRIGDCFSWGNDILKITDIIELGNVGIIRIDVKGKGSELMSINRLHLLIMSKTINFSHHETG